MPPKKKKEGRKGKGITSSSSAPTIDAILDPDALPGSEPQDPEKLALVEELRRMNLNDQKDVVAAQLAAARREAAELKAQLAGAVEGELFSLEELRSKAKRSQEYAQAMLLEGAAKEREHQLAMEAKEREAAVLERKLREALSEVEYRGVQVRERDARLAETEAAVALARRLQDELDKAREYAQGLRTELSLRNRQLRVLAQLDRHPAAPAPPPPPAARLLAAAAAAGGDPAAAAPGSPANTAFSSAGNASLSTLPSADGFGALAGSTTAAAPADGGGARCSPFFGGDAEPGAWGEPVAADGRAGVGPLLLEAMRLFQTRCYFHGC